MRRVSRVHFGKRRCRREISAGQTVVPGQSIFVPHGPQKTHKKSARGKHITHAPPQQLSGGWCFTGETGDLQSAQHHSRRRPTENRKERKVLQVHNDESSDAYCGAQLAECELSPERTKQCQEASVCEKEERRVDQSSDSALIHRS